MPLNCDFERNEKILWHDQNFIIIVTPNRYLKKKTHILTGIFAHKNGWQICDVIDAGAVEENFDTRKTLSVD